MAHPLFSPTGLWTPRLLLMPLTDADAAAVYALLNDPRVARHYAEPPIPEADGAVDFVRRIRGAGRFPFAVRRRDDPGALIGLAALHHWDTEAGRIEIGGALAADHWGQGLMREAFTALIDLARRELGVRAVTGRTRPANLRAIRLVESLGFREVERTAEEVVLERRVDELAVDELAVGG